MTALLFVSYSGILGGAERILLDEAGAVPGAHVLACPGGELADAARGIGLSVLELPGRDLRLRGGAQARALAGLAAHARELRRLAADLDPDLIVAWGMRSMIAAALAAPRPPVALAHNDFLPGPAIAAAVRAAAARSAVVVALSDAVARDLDPRGRLGGRVVVVHPGIDPDRFAGGGRVGGVGGVGGVVGADTGPEVLVLGALTAWKAPELAVAICARVRATHPGLTLRIVGSPIASGDPTPARLRALAAGAQPPGAVVLAGRSEDPAGELARATCLLHCAPREPFGLVLLEAMAAGRPVVAPDAGGPREIVDDSCGRLYAPGDVAAGAAALAAVLDAPDRGRSLGEAGRARVRARFGRERARAEFAAALAPVRRTRARHPGPTDRLCLVTVTHNSARALPGLLDSVARHLPGARVIVADCASSDASLALARDRPGVTAIALAENIGFGRACNRALDAVTEPVTALVNPDVVLLDDGLLALAAEAVRTDRPERLLAPRVLSGDGTRQDTAHPVPAGVADLVRAVLPPALVPGPAGVALAPWRAHAPRRIGWAVGCALVARTTTLRALGPFDPSLFLYGEDLELGLRARRAGIDTWFWPSAVVVHHRAHATAAAFGGEPLPRLAAARHTAVTLGHGPRRAGLDDRAQAVTFASRRILKRALGRPAERERLQLAAVRALRTEGVGGS